MSGQQPRTPYPTDLTDEQWAVIEPWVRRASGPGAPTQLDLREVVNALLYLNRSGCAWRLLPHDFPPWQTVYGLFRRWQRDGTWPRMLTALQALADAAGLITWDVSVDSTIARAHQHAAGARKRGSADRTTRRGCRDRAGRPRAGAVVGWLDHEAAPGLRAGS